jgi:hypothetical protein
MDDARQRTFLVARVSWTMEAKVFSRKEYLSRTSHHAGKPFPDFPCGTRLTL